MKASISTKNSDFANGGLKNDIAKGKQMISWILELIEETESERFVEM